MNYPLISEYIESIRYAEDNFATLTNLRPVLDEYGNPIMSSGNFAVVFKMQDIETKEYFAAKCFTREQEGRETAYQKIAEALININSPYIVQLHYYNDELYVNSSQTDNTDFPVVLMQWVEGENLENYISNHINDVYAIHHVFGAFVKMAIWLLQQPFAHGDLKPDNIMIRQDGTIVLVDYDGMYVTSMIGEASREMGSPDFRHPQRNRNEFNDSIDIFAITAIALSLSYVAKRAQSDLTESVIFLSEQDHVRPDESKLLNAILKNSVGTVCGKILSLYQLVLSDRYTQKSAIVSILLSFFNNDTNITDFDLNNSFSIGQIRYSFDGRKIFEVHSDFEQINLVFEIQQGVEILCNESLRYIEDNSIVVIPSVVS